MPLMLAQPGYLWLFQNIYLLLSLSRLRKKKLGSKDLTGEFVHPNVIYSMEIDANMRRLSIGAALSEAGSQYSV
jgi:hypothetical protein